MRQFVKHLTDEKKKEEVPQRFGGYLTSFHWSFHQRMYASQCRALTRSSAATMARNATEKSWRKMVTAKRISTTRTVH
jgi:hypothetical protein